MANVSRGTISAIRSSDVGSELFHVKQCLRCFRGNEKMFHVEQFGGQEKKPKKNVSRETKSKINLVRSETFVILQHK